jgi:YD repeat-containing protein
MRWTRDAFGCALTFTDLSGIVTRYDYNHAKKLTRQRNNDSNRRSAGTLDRYQIINGPLVAEVASISLVPVLGQDIEYKYLQSHLLEIRDRVGLQLMRFQLDTEGRRTRTEIRKLDPKNPEGDGELIRVMTSSLDALGRETTVIDSNVMLDIAYDAASNRRLTNASILNSAGDVTVQNTINAFDRANRLKDQSSGGSSIKKTYERNLIKTINTNGFVDTLTHDEDHLLKETSSTDGSFTKRDFDKAARLETFSDKSGNRAQT